MRFQLTVFFSLGQVSSILGVFCWVKLAALLSPFKLPHCTSLQKSCSGIHSVVYFPAPTAFDLSVIGPLCRDAASHVLPPFPMACKCSALCACFVQLHLTQLHAFFLYNLFDWVCAKLTFRSSMGPSRAMRFSASAYRGIEGRCARQLGGSALLWSTMHVLLQVACMSFICGSAVILLGCVHMQCRFRAIALMCPFFAERAPGSSCGGLFLRRTT
jgi:hypothetical protein